MKAVFTVVRASGCNNLCIYVHFYYRKKDQVMKIIHNCKTEWLC